METKKAQAFRGKTAEKQGARRFGNARDRKPKKPADPGYLERAGVYYLQRFASSVENFKSVMRRKVQKRGLPEDVSSEEAEGWIDGLASRFVRAGLLDDAVYARSRVQSLHRQGKPLRAIRQTLRAKQVSPDDIEAALNEIFENQANPDLQAAIAFARRRRFGPFNPGDAPDRAAEQKILASFARAGFSYGDAKRVLDAPSEDALEALALDLS